MNKHDLFAALAMHAMLTNELQEVSGITLEELAEEAYRMADAMIAVRDQEGNNDES